jgi:hypothetical protein
MRGIGSLVAGLLLALAVAVPAGAQARTMAVAQEASYGTGGSAFFVVFPAGPSAVVLLHENGQTWKTVHGQAEALQRAGYTVLDVEWEQVAEKIGSQIWGPLTERIEGAVGYAVAHAGELGIDPNRIAMVGGSRGANLALLAGPALNAKAPGTIKALVSLSGDVDPLSQLERAQSALALGEEPNAKVVRKFTTTFGCKEGLRKCPTDYIAKWSPLQKAKGPTGASEPPTLLAASLTEEYTAEWEDLRPMTEVLEGHGVPAVALIPERGHGFTYWGAVYPNVLAFLRENNPAAFG